MSAFILALAVTASPSAHLLPSPELVLAAQAPHGLTALATHVAAEAESPWTGDRGRNRIIGLALTGGAGVLTLTGIALLISAATVGAYSYPANYCDPRLTVCYGYPYAYAPSPVPYIIAAIAVLAGAGTAAGFGVPMLLKGFRD